MEYKQLIKELKDLRLKADPQNHEKEMKAWRKKNDEFNLSEKRRYEENKISGHTAYFRARNLNLLCRPDLVKNQLKVIDIENALYGYWERNVKVENASSLTPAEYLATKPDLFNDWLDNQINNIDETATGGQTWTTITGIK